jgi:hypothetical protein
MLHGRWGCYAPEKAKLQIPPCSPNLILAKLEIIGLLFLAMLHGRWGYGAP